MKQGNLNSIFSYLRVKNEKTYSKLNNKINKNKSSLAKMIWLKMDQVKVKNTNEL